MENFASTIICATSGTTATTAAAAAGENVLFWVGIGVTVATTIFNLVRDCRKKWHADTDEINKKRNKK